MINGSIQEKKGNLYAVLSIKKAGGGYKQKWVSMGMKSTTGKRKQQERLDELREKYTDIISVEALEILFCDYIKKWNEETKADKRLTTYDGYVHMIDKYIYPYFKEKGFALADLRTCDINAYYKWLQRDCGLSGNTALKHHQIIYTSLKYAVINRILKNNPCETVTRPKKEKAEHDFYNADEIKALIQYSKNDPLEVVVYLAVLLGLRREEVLGLRWENVDFDKHTIRICETVVRAKQGGKLVSVAEKKTKTETSNRVLDMSKAKEIESYLYLVRQAQNEQAVTCGDSYYVSDYVCVDKLGYPIKPDYVTHRFAKILKKYGLRRITFHDLRHSTASYMLAKGYSMKEIQEFLGHSNYNFTADTYTHVDNSAKQAMISTISADILACL